MFCDSRVFIWSGKRFTKLPSIFGNFDASARPPNERVGERVGDLKTRRDWRPWTAMTPNKAPYACRRTVPSLCDLPSSFATTSCLVQVALDRQ